MLLLMLVFGLVTAIYRERGWFSPLIGITAVLVQPLIEMFLGGALGLFLFTPEHNVEDYSELAFFGLGLYAALCTILLYYVLSRLVPKIDSRKLAKASNVPYRTIGYLIVIGAVALAAYLLYLGITTDDRSVSRMVSGVAVLAVFSAWPCFNLGRQQRRAAARWQLLEAKRPPILYLRSFDLENASRQSMRIGAFDKRSNRTFDEMLESATADLGVMIALGDPQDYLPSAGALKVYPSDDDWQDYVIRLAAVSRAIFLVEGDSGGLSWELRHLRESVAPEKIFILTAQRKYRKTFRRKHKASLWGAFRAQLLRAGFVGLDKDPGFGAVLRFDDQLRPRVIARGLKRADAYKKVLENELSSDDQSFDYRAISDLIFTGIVDTDIAENPINFPQVLRMVALAVVSIAVFSGIALTGWYYLDAHSLLSRVENTQLADEEAASAPKHLIYRGQALPYSLELDSSWQQHGRIGDFDTLFEHRSGEAAIGVIAEKAEGAAASIDVNHYVNAILNRANQASSEPLQISHRDKRTIDGREWELVRYLGDFEGKKLHYSLAFQVGYDGIYQLLGWTLRPQTYNDELDTAMGGFRFPIRKGR